MPHTPAKIVKVEIAHKRRAGWPSVWVREITETGRVRNRWEFGNSREADACARCIAREHGAEIVTA